MIVIARIILAIYNYCYSYKIISDYYCYYDHHYYSYFIFSDQLLSAQDSTAYGPTGGWFDRKDSSHPFRSIVDVLYFTAMGPPGGGRNFITPRAGPFIH